MAVDTLVLNFAYVALLASTFTRTVTWLRLMLIVGAIGFIAFGLLDGNVTMVAWNILTGTMHAVRVARERVARRSVSLTPDEERLRDAYFPDLDDFDFTALWRMGTDVTYCDELVIVVGERSETVGLIIDGQAQIWRGSELVRVMRRGGLLGEMHFVSGDPAAVDVRAQGTLVVHEWQGRDLVMLDQLRPSVARAFRSYIAGDLVAKARA